MIIIDAAMLIRTGFTYTKKEKVIDAEPMQVSADREKALTGLVIATVYWS